MWCVADTGGLNIYTKIGVTPTVGLEEPSARRKTGTGGNQNRPCLLNAVAG